MRVLQVISGIEPENGGPTAALVGHCRALVAAGVQTSVVATWKSRSSFGLAEILRQQGVPVTLLGPTRRPFRRHRDLNATVEQAINVHDVVHIHAVWEAIEHRAAVLARRLNKPYVWTPHGMLDAWNMRRNHLFKRVCLAAYLRRDLQAAARIHAATDFEAKNIGRLHLGVPFFVQGFGLDDYLLNASMPRGLFRTRHALGDGKIVLFLGRIQRGKGLETLVPALARMATPATLVIAGPDEGDFRRRIESLIAAHRVTDRVRFVGMLHGDEKLQALTDADALAAPSAHENFGIAVAEAISLGTAVVVSDQVGLGTLIGQHDLGRVAPLDPAATAAALDAVLPTSEERSRRARRVAREAFDQAAVARQWRDLYQTAATSE